MRSRSLALTALALALAPAAPLAAQLTVRLPEPPAGTPAGAAVYLAGSFNRWAPDDVRYRMGPDAAHGYTITLPDDVRGDVEFKLTLGSWDTAEADSLGAGAPNRRVHVPATGALTVVARVPSWTDPDAKAPIAHSAIASVAVVTDSFAIPQLGRTRRVWVYLPRGYATSHARYPVLYLQDGQNLFDAATGFAGEWGVDETLDSLRAAVIVVAVDNGGTHRLDEYNPWKNADPKLGGGEGDAYVDFLVHTLKPYVDAHWRTRRDAASTGIGGSSAGALIALYATLRHPEVYGRALLFSTASWLAGQPLYDVARRAAARHPRARLFFLSGEHETPEGQPGLDQRRMVDTLVRAGWPAARIRSVLVPDGKHAEWFWRREFGGAFQWLFGATPSRTGTRDGDAPGAELATGRRRTPSQGWADAQ